MLCCQHSLLPVQDNLIISIDRTEWKSGKHWVNILMAAVIYNGTAFPIFWCTLPGRKSSSTEERIAFMQQLLSIIPQQNRQALLADREFIGQDWFVWLIRENIPFFIRIRNNARTTSANAHNIHVKQLFANLQAQQTRFIKQQRNVYGHQLWLSGTKSNGDYLLVASNRTNPDALDLYDLRWGIETLFLNLKTRGFRLEDTHLQQPQRIAKLIAILAISFHWAYLVGLWLNNSVPLKSKKHGHLSMSFFRYGLNLLQKLSSFLDNQSLYPQFRLCIDLLRHPSLALPPSPA